jgi:hypothetical protein
MSTPNSSTQLRAAVDNVASDLYETAFVVLDLVLATTCPTQHDPSSCRRCSLRATLRRLLIQLDGVAREE